MSKLYPEKKFQTLLCDAVRAQGGYALKMSNQFMVGIPDLHLKVPGLPDAFIECKTDQLRVSDDAKIQLDLTEMQRLDIRKRQAAGSLAGWCLGLVTRDAMGLHLWFGVDPEVRSMEQRRIIRDSLHVTRPFSKVDVREMIRSLHHQFIERSLAFTTSSLKG